MNIAIITALTPDFLDQFKLFICSLRQFSKIPVIAVVLEDDHKIPIATKYECIEERLDPIVIQEFKKTNDNRWMQWHKPEIIAKIADKYELDLVLWLDTDIVVLADIAPIIQNITQSFTVMEDYFAPLTTINDTKLYDIYPSNNSQPEKALNSGVVGFMLPRDRYILDEWISRSKLAVSNEDCMKCISLYDQGTLIWAMKELKILDLIIDKPEWNCAPKRHAYEAAPNHKWPFGQHSMGGDLFNEIRYDNPGAIVVHFAGCPKLTDLLIHNHRRSIAYNIHQNKVHDINKKHIFVVGLERCGTHSLAEILRRSTLHSSWIRHEANVKDDYGNKVLSYAAFCKYRGIDFDYQSYIRKRIEYYDRHDVNLICDSNHRLGFFIKEIKNHIENAKFILMLRSPIQLIKSRLCNFCLWPALIKQYPLEYQLDLYNIHTKFTSSCVPGSTSQNLHRIFPNHLLHIDQWEASIIESHLWEVNTTLQFIMDQLVCLPNCDYEIMWIDDLPREISKLKNLINKKHLDFNIVKHVVKYKFGESHKPSAKIYEWIDSNIQSNASLILSNFDQLMSKYNINYCDNLVT